MTLYILQFMPEGANYKRRFLKMCNFCPLPPLVDTFFSHGIYVISHLLGFNPIGISHLRRHCFWKPPKQFLLASIAELELRRRHNNKNAEAEMMTRKYINVWYTN